MKQTKRKQTCVHNCNILITDLAKMKDRIGMYDAGLIITGDTGTLVFVIMTNLVPPVTT